MKCCASTPVLPVRAIHLDSLVALCPRRDHDAASRAAASATTLPNPRRSASRTGGARPGTAKRVHRPTIGITSVGMRGVARRCHRVEAGAVRPPTEDSDVRDSARLLAIGYGELTQHTSPLTQRVAQRRGLVPTKLTWSAQTRGSCPFGTAARGCRRRVPRRPRSLLAAEPAFPMLR